MPLASLTTTPQKRSRSGMVIRHHLSLCKSGRIWERAQAPEYSSSTKYSTCVNVTKAVLSFHLSLVRVISHLHHLVVLHCFALGTQPTALGGARNSNKHDHNCVFGLPAACWHQPFPTNPYPTCPHMPTLSKQLSTVLSTVVDRESSLEDVQ